jgi:hypothetical protein
VGNYSKNCRQSQGNSEFNDLPTGEQLLADGTTRMLTLKPAKRKAKAKPKLRPRSTDPLDIEIALREALEELLKPLGFRRKSETQFARTFKGGSDVVNWLGVRGGGRTLTG